MSANEEMARQRSQQIAEEACTAARVALRTEREANAKKINLRASESQLERWRQAADADQRSLSSWIRVALDAACE